MKKNYGVQSTSELTKLDVELLKKVEKMRLEKIKTIIEKNYEDILSPNRWTTVYQLLKSEINENELSDLLSNIISNEVMNNDVTELKNAYIEHYAGVLFSTYNIQLDLGRFEVEGLVGDILSNFE